jgi:hypothetical protein
MTPVSSSSAILISKNPSDTVKKSLGAGQSISRLLVPFTRIRFGQMIPDDLLITSEAAAGGNTVEHADPEPLVARRYIGPDVHENLSTNGRNT